MFWKDFLYTCWSWLPALAHGKIEENTVNSGIFNGWGDKGIGSIVEHDVFDRFYGDKSVKYPCFEGNHCKNMETHSKNTGFGGLSRRRCLAIWNFAAWRTSKGGKSENSIAWEAVTAGKSENSLAWEAPTGGKSENSLAWGAPTGGKSENSLAWGAPTGGKIPSLGSPHGGEKWKFPSLGSPTGGKSENSLAWGAPTGGKVKILSLGSPHGGKPPLAPLTDRNKPAVWAATPREAGWIV